MNFYIMTLFPEMVMDGLNTSIIGRAVNKGLLSIEALNIRDYAFNKHHSVDDYPYGGGAGMLMQAEPVYLSYESIVNRIGKRPRVIFLTPQGKTFNQNMAKEFALEEDLVFLCGHYEGVDERVLEMIATDYLSAGDYVLTGGELGALVVVDAVGRLCEGVLADESCYMDESHYNGLLEYPHYTRPPVWHGREVPEVLQNGNHAKIDQWRREKSLENTLRKRPDLLRTAPLTDKDKQMLRRLREEQSQTGDDTEE